MISKRISSWLCFLLLTGCASVSVRDPKQPKEAVTPPTEKPERIFVEAFSTDEGQFNVDREGAELTEFKAKTSRILQEQMVKRLPEIASTHVARGSLPNAGWLIRGQFVRVNQGSRALRGIIGFGLGATKMETKVQVYDLSQSSTVPFLIFDTTGGSNAEPGAIIGAGPPDLITAGTIVLSSWNVVHGVTEDSWRTAREIRNYLVQYEKEHSVIAHR